MKKIIILCILITVTIITANAQLFMEGSVGLNYRDSERSASISSFSISPKVGYWLNDNIAIGINPIVSISTYKNMMPYDVFEPDYDSQKDRMWMFSVFGRYKLWGTEKLSLLIETPVGFGISTRKEEINAINTANYSNSLFSIIVNPLASYKLSERFSIVTRCNFLSFGFYSFNDKDKNTNSKSTNNQFSFNAQSSFFDSLGNISIGFIYNFKNNSNN